MAKRTLTDAIAPAFYCACVGFFAIAALTKIFHASDAMANGAIMFGSLFVWLVSLLAFSRN